MSARKSCQFYCRRLVRADAVPGTEPGIPVPTTCLRKIRLRCVRVRGLLGGPTVTPIVHYPASWPEDHLEKTVKGAQAEGSAAKRGGLLGEIRGGFREEGKFKQKVRGREGLGWR